MGEKAAMKLKDGLFYLVVYGPGYGESIVLRDPGGTWVIVDGCLTNGRSPAAEILREHDASWSSVVITHPHRDHALGLDTVLGRPGDGLIGCVAPSVAEPRAWSQTVDGERHVREGTVEHVLAAIHDRWTHSPECKWEMRCGESKNVGDLTLTVLHPDDATVAARPTDPNRLSSALLVTWRHVHLLLGGDVVADDWTQVGSTFREMGAHQGMKLPHHGSCGAVHDCWGEGVAQRTGIATPNNRGHNRPRFD
ncbi:MAG: MBL fold metallo-hydrolase, partial [Pseudomonadota bacterium]